MQARAGTCRKTGTDVSCNGATRRLPTFDERDHIITSGQKGLPMSPAIHVHDFARARITEGGAESGKERQEVGHSSGMRLEHDKREATLGNILLILKPPVDCHEDLKATLARGAQQDAVLHARPSARLDSRCVEFHKVDSRSCGTDSSRRTRDPRWVGLVTPRRAPRALHAQGQATPGPAGA